jgi:6-phosphogluconolactonase (cycloisomerase 2 family)
MSTFVLPGMTEYVRDASAGVNADPDEMTRRLSSLSAYNNCVTLLAQACHAPPDDAGGLVDTAERELAELRVAVLAASAALADVRDGLAAQGARADRPAAHHKPHAHGHHK